MNLVERVGRVGDRVFDALRDKRAFALTDEAAVDAPLDSLRGNAYAVLVTFRRDGEAVPSPVWFGIDEDGATAYVKTRRDAGKVKRLRNDSRAVIAPSTMRGKPTGPAIRATARILRPDEHAHAERTIRAAYKSPRNTVDRVLGGPDEAAAYLAITPRARA